MADQVTAVVVTHNRKDLLVECLHALRSQTRPVQAIIVIDNASSDGTRELLQERGLLMNGLVRYVELPVNIGGAGGFHRGLELAYRYDCDWAWLMDDDAEPAADALEQLMPVFEMHDVLAAASLVEDKQGVPQFAHHGWAGGCLEYAPIRRISDRDMASDLVEIDRASFVGLAVSKSAVQQIGLPRAEFFIHHDDFEYCRRIRTQGRILLATRSRIRHKQARPRSGRSVSSLGVVTTRYPVQDIWLTYYGPRNMVWEKKQECALAPTLIYAARMLFRKWIGVLLYDDKKLFRMRFYLHSIWDGLQGRFDNEKPRRLVIMAGLSSGRATRP